jgi:hypothetical protein
MVDSAEAVAWELLLMVARAEGVSLDAESSPPGWSQEQILATYRECLGAVNGGERPARTRFRIVD